MSIAIISCQSGSNKEGTNPTKSPNGSLEPTTAEGTWAPAGPDGIVYHYVCPDRCDGGVLDNEGVCHICGKPLQHNTAFHINNDNPTATPAADQHLKPRNTTFDPAKSPNGLWHFICPNGHDGAGEAGSCAACGEELAHNQLYHTDTENQDEPAQNSKGVWHFICSEGHEGGAGAPVYCDVCGATLVHNTEYHN